MKKQNTIQISIPEPCHENWEDMTEMERGRFCSSCQKVVTDFTQMEDAEIIQIIKEGKGHCGRFTAAQLDRPLIPAIEKPRYFVIPFYKKIAASLLIMAAFAEKTFAQQKKQTSTQQQVTTIKKSKAPVIISGHLLDFETQKPIPNRTIFLKNESFELQSKTNKWGGFTFSIPGNQQKDLGILNIDTTGTNYIVVDEEISLEKVSENLQLFCYSQPELLKPISKVSFRKEVYQKFKAVSKGVIAPAPVRNLVDLPSLKPSFWHRITHPFRKKKKH